MEQMYVLEVTEIDGDEKVEVLVGVYTDTELMFKVRDGLIEYYEEKNYKKQDYYKKNLFVQMDNESESVSVVLDAWPVTLNKTELLQKNIITKILMDQELK